MILNRGILYFALQSKIIHSYATVRNRCCIAIEVRILIKNIRLTQRQKHFLSVTNIENRFTCIPIVVC